MQHHRLSPVITFLASMLFIAGFIAGCGQQNRHELTTPILKEDIRAHIEYLASDQLKGREAGTAQEAIAANYIADQFRDMGLQPAGNSNTYFQEFSVVKGVKNAPKGSYIRAGNKRYSSFEDKALPWGGSKSATVTGELVFAGYGIQAPDANYNDYENLDVRNRMVLIMRHGPGGDQSPHGTFGKHWGMHKKVQTAQQQGAAGVIVTAGPLHESAEPFLPVTRKAMKADSEIPVLQVTPGVADSLLARTGLSLADLQRRIDEATNPASRSTGQEVEISVNLVEDQRLARNVLASVQGVSNPDEYLVIGAHFDHLGMGGSGSLASAEDPAIHNGADDNASGTAGLLELAHYFSQQPIDKSILFIAFSAEEMGLLGSKYFVNHPTVPLEQVRAMINMDMIGRLRDKLLVFGTGSSGGWETAIDSATTDTLLQPELVPDAAGSSDHTSFYHQQIPVLHYFTDTHSDYHRPSDDPQFINYAGTESVVEHVANLLQYIDDLPADSLRYTEAPVTDNRNIRLDGPTLGVLPDYGFNGTGMRITGTSEGPAQKAGLQADDIITKLNGKPVHDIYDYMEILNGLKKGDQTTVTVQRGSEELRMDLQL